MNLQYPQICALSLAFLLAGCSKQENPDRFVREASDPDSVTVIENGMLPAEWNGELPSLVLEDEWTLGGDLNRDETIFRSLSPEILAEGMDERVGVVNTRPPELRVFDKEGLLLWKAGREGDGPGEFRNPNGLVYKDGVGWVVSEGLKKTIFEEQGTYLNTINLSRLPYGPNGRDFELGRHGNFWYLGLRMASEGNARRMTYHVIAGNLQDMTATELYSFAQPALPQEEGKMLIMEDWPMVLCTDAQNRAWVVGDLPYQIEVIPHSGIGRFRIRRQYELQEYDPAYRREFESGWERYAAVPYMWPRLPDRQPAIRNISRGPDGEMWVFTKAWIDSPMVQVDVFNEDGVFTRAFLADAALAGYPFFKTHVYREDRAEDGAPLLIRSRHLTVKP